MVVANQFLELVLSRGDPRPTGTGHLLLQSGAGSSRAFYTKGTTSLHLFSMLLLLQCAPSLF